MSGMFLNKCEVRVFFKLLSLVEYLYIIYMIYIYIIFVTIDAYIILAGCQPEFFRNIQGLVGHVTLLELLAPKQILFVVGVV